jgi:hypothetical protein
MAATNELNASTLGKDLEWFVQGMATKFGVDPAKIEAQVTIYDDLRGEQVTVGWKNL